MNTNLTDITLVIDRSGSMNSCRSDAEGGVNAFVESQATQTGEALLTLVQFDTEYEFVHRGIPIRNAPKYTLVPRGMTALYDAVVRAIAEVGERLAGMAEADRPGLVLFAIVTDGMENASKEYTGEQIRKMIEHQTSIYSWQFTYLGANQDAIGAAGNIGIAPGAAMDYDVARSGATFDIMSEQVSFLRTRAAAGVPAPALLYTDEQRASSLGSEGVDGSSKGAPKTPGASRRKSPKGA